MKILIPLFSPATGTWGGLTRVIAVAQAAQEAGHRVSFCASGYLEESLKRRGYKVYSTPATTFLGLPAPLSRMIERRSQRTRLPIKSGRDFGNIWFVMLISGLARGRYLRELVAAELRAAEEFKADRIFTDLDPGAFLLSQITDIPVSAAYQSPMKQGIGSLPWKALNRAIHTVQKAYHLPPQSVDQLCHGSQVLKIIPSIPELEDTDPGRPDVCYVGQLLGDIQPTGTFEPEEGRRYVFVYVGTGAISLDQLRSVLPQVFPQNGTYICLVGAQSINNVERIGSVEFHPYIPSADVLPYCDWTICHAGQNTIIQSLLNKVPLLLFPGPIFERRYNARKVQAAGAGQMGELDNFNSGFLKSALEKQAEQAACASDLAIRIQSLGGAQTALHAIERWNPDSTATPCLY